MRDAFPEARGRSALKGPAKPENAGRLPAELIIGVGNDFRSDDAAGLEVARRLGEKAPPEMRVIAREGEPVDLIEEWAGADEAIVVDAVRSGAEPGTVHRLEAHEGRLPSELFRGSTHALGVAEAVELARALERLPAQLTIIGIEGASFEAGRGLSAPVEAAVGSVVDGLLADRAKPRR